MSAAVAQRFTPEKKQRFLEALASYGNVTQAAKSVGVTRRICYTHRKEDEAFAAEWELAEQEGGNALEDEARRRAYRGVLEPVYQGGEKVGTVRKYSDTLLIFLLKGAKPEKYRDNFHVTGAVGVLGISELLERMRGDTSLTDAAAEYVGLVDAPSEAHE